MHIIKTSIFIILCTAAFGAPEMPADWNRIAGRKASVLWDICWEDERFMPTRLVNIYRQAGSQHDGDRQFEVAQLLATVSHDPYKELKYLLQSPDPYDVGFVIQVVNCLGDNRFIPDLRKLEKDSRSLSKWDVLGYKTVADAAIKTIASLRKGSRDLEGNLKIANWLEKSHKNIEKIQED